jgi:O-antigen/teichoic acid export membrane protein
MNTHRPSTTTLRQHSTRSPRLFTELSSRVRDQIRTPLYGNVYALTLNTVLTTILGMGYWVLAARLYTPEQVGRGAAIISTMVFLSSLSQLNLNGALARFLPAAGRRGGRLIMYAYGAASGVAVLLATGFVLLAPLVSDQARLPSSAPLLGFAFVVAVAAWTLFALQDTVLTALRGAFWVPVENAIFGAAKIVILVVLATAASGLGIFLSWTVSAVVMLVPVNLLVFARLLPRLYERPETATFPGRGILIRFVTADYVGYLFYQTTTNGLPVLVTAVLGAEANAVFYIGWLLGGSLELITYHFATSLTVESAPDPSQLAANLRRILRRGLLLFSVAAVLMVICAPLLLKVFGPQYADASTMIVQLFAIAVVPKFVVAMFVAVCRVQRNVRRIVLVQASTAALVIPLGVLFMRTMGVIGVGLAYLIAQVVLAAAVMPTLTRLIRSAT